ncbi:hypothetical protein EVAR_20412_1 [Eumeta japonica]|uniref:Uncharacterized protein n=1 Tax=Eumeta variegata TaxID=151549 RepID=A0A4C1TXU7_EUMVA|nr:hypothetical protein EVAR_20412_1 [Eumeta japonica]
MNNIGSTASTVPKTLMSRVITHLITIYGTHKFGENTNFTVRHLPPIYCRRVLALMRSARSPITAADYLPYQHFYGRAPGYGPWPLRAVVFVRPYELAIHRF